MSLKPHERMIVDLTKRPVKPTEGLGIVEQAMARDEAEHKIATEWTGGGVSTVRTVPDRLTALGDLYRERNKLYGDNYKHFGKTLAGLFPHGITLQGAEQFNRFALFIQCVHKLSRYARGGMTEGHPDSLDDNAVYSQLLSEYDELCKVENRHD